MASDCQWNVLNLKKYYTDQILILYEELKRQEKIVYNKLLSNQYRESGLKFNALLLNSVYKVRKITQLEIRYECQLNINDNN